MLRQGKITTQKPLTDLQRLHVWGKMTTRKPHTDLQRLHVWCRYKWCKRVKSMESKSPYIHLSLPCLFTLTYVLLQRCCTKVLILTGKRDTIQCQLLSLAMVSLASTLNKKLEVISLYWGFGLRNDQPNTFTIKLFIPSNSYWEALEKSWRNQKLTIAELDPPINSQNWISCTKLVHVFY